MENAYLIILMFGAYAGIYFLYKFYFERKKEQLNLKKALLLKSSAFYPYIPEIFSQSFYSFSLQCYFTLIFQELYIPDLDCGNGFFPLDGNAQNSTPRRPLLFLHTSSSFI